MPPSVAVVKVGGSLYDLPDLRSRLSDWLAQHFPRNSGADVVLVPGGGPAVDTIRQLDQRHGLGEETSHWLALRVLSVNAHFLAALLPSTWVIGTTIGLCEAWEKGKLPILDAYKYARGDEQRSGRLPHSWTVTSDTLAARVACVLHARRLMLLKSTTIPPGIDWQQAGQRGLVDPMFAEVLRQAPGELLVETVNLRTWNP